MKVLDFLPQYFKVYHILDKYINSIEDISIVNPYCNRPDIELISNQCIAFKIKFLDYDTFISFCETVNAEEMIAFLSFDGNILYNVCCINEGPGTYWKSKKNIPEFDKSNNETIFYFYFK